MRLAPLLLLAACTACGDAAPAPDPTAAPEPAGSQPAPNPAVVKVPVGDPAAEYRYTRLDNCRLLRSAPDEAGFFEHECAGEGGWKLRNTEADLREDLTLVAPGGGEHDLSLVALAQGAFSSLGDTVEWRGTVTDGRFVPHALIVRQQVQEDPDPDVAEKSYLVAVRLAPRPCVVARVAPGAGQNARARAVADRPPACLAGN
jgi:hypothetical protein